MADEPKTDGAFLDRLADIGTGRWSKASRDRVLSLARRGAAAGDLLEALRPFAEAWQVVMGNPPHVLRTLTLGQLGKLAEHEVSGTHFQRAATAIARYEALTTQEKDRDNG